MTRRTAKPERPGGKSLAEFDALHNPFYEDQSPAVIFPWTPRRGQTSFIFTAAQNATPVHVDFWRVLNVMAEAKGAELRVIPTRYKNPTSRWSGSQGNSEVWAPETKGLLTSVRTDLNDNLSLMADFKLQPTAGDPVGHGDLHAVSRASSAIVGHPKLQTRSVATPQNKMAKLLMTSGMATVSNYSDTRAGRVAEFHHSLSAVLVELKGKKFFCRRVHYDAKTRSATDAAMGVRYYADGTTERAPRAWALVCGDLHNDYADPAVLEATFGAGGLRELCDPRYVIYHDIDDGYANNPHHRGNPFNKVAKHRAHADNVRSELERVVSFLREHTYKDVTNVIVPDNHSNDFLNRWIVGTDWRDDPVNAEFYLETALMMVRGTKLGSSGTDYPDAFRYWLRKAGLPQLRVLETDESFVLADVALDMHGNLGPNGSRGSIRNLRRVGVKSIIGHSHSPGEDEGAMQVGTSTRLRLEYNKGPSSWLNAHAVLGDDGKRQLVVIVDGEFHA